MKKFIFTLQSVLNVKRALEKQHMGDLSDCNARIRKFEQRLRDAKERREAQLQNFMQQLNEGMSAQELSVWRDANLTTLERVAYEEDVLDKANGERARIERRLLILMQERKILEKLKEKQLEDYRLELNRAAAIEISEFMGHNVFNAEQNKTGR